jgi:hypothetical protein
MKFTQVHSQYSSQLGPICRTNNVAQQFSCLTFDNGTEARDGEKRSWITSGGHTLIGIDWHPFGVLEADDYHQNYHWQFGNQFIFINYIFMKKNEFKLLYTNYVKICDQERTNTRDFQWREESPPCMVTNTTLTCLVGPQT